MIHPTRALLLAALLATPAAGQHTVQSETTVVEGQDFQVYDGWGRARSFADLIAALGSSDAVLVGESHDDAVGHGVETELLLRATQRYGAGSGAAGRPIVLSLEMFERDVQYILDEYLDDLVTEDQFLRSARPWDRYETDYRPMVEFARGHGLPVVAANAPRRYVNRVTRLGPTSLGDLGAEAKRYLPPLPYPGPSDPYAAQWNALMDAMMPDTGATPRHDMGNALQSQALWDAAMGHSVAEALTRWPRALVIHYAGSFHVENGTGIPERVPEYRPGTRVTTVVLQPVDDVYGWDESHRGLGDFVILTRTPGAAS